MLSKILNERRLRRARFAVDPRALMACVPCDLSVTVCRHECIDHASVQMGKWSVHEVRVVHVGMHGHFCRPLSAASTARWKARRQVEA